jgi:predicted metalloprotease
MFRELQADCFAGAYARFLEAGQSTRLALEEGDLEEGATFLFAIGDTSSMVRRAGTRLAL